MKKFLSVILALVMVLSLSALFVGCDSDTVGENETTAGATDAATDAGTTAPDETEKPVLKMGTNAYFQPYEFYEGEKIVGIDAEIAAAIAEKLGMTLEIVDMEFDSILTAVNEGSVDFGMAGMTITEDRLLEVDFSISYANGVQSIIVKNDSPIATADDLAPIEVPERKSWFVKTLSRFVSFIFRQRFTISTAKSFALSSIMLSAISKTFLLAKLLLCNSEITS